MINMNRFNYILIYINNISSYNHNISNITTKTPDTVNLVAIINRSDALPFSNISYVEINDNNKIILSNKHINNLNFCFKTDFLCFYSSFLISSNYSDSYERYC